MCDVRKRKERGSTRKPKKRKVKSGNRGVEGETGRVETKRICSDRLSSQVFEVLRRVSEMESVGNSSDSSVCVCLLCLLLCLL